MNGIVYLKRYGIWINVSCYGCYGGGDGKGDECIDTV